MEQSLTLRNVMQRMAEDPNFEYLEIGGTKYVSAALLAARLGVSRQTLWRWRAAGKIPAGHLYRSRQLIFTVAEAADVYAYGTRVEPADTLTNPDQMALFTAKKRGAR
jgi:hypothetical protein